MQDKAGYWAEAPVSVGWRNGAGVELWQSGEQKADIGEQKQDIPKESFLFGIAKPAVYKKCSPSIWYLYPYTQYFQCNCLRVNIMHSLRQTMPTKPLHSVAFSVPEVESPLQTSLVLQWPIKGKTQSLCVCVCVCVHVCAPCRCLASQAARWRRCSYSGTPGGLFSATATSTPHILSTLFRQQVETEPTKWFSVCLPSFFVSHFFISPVSIAEAGFLGLLGGLPEELRRMFPVTKQSSAGLTQQNSMFLDSH